MRPSDLEVTILTAERLDYLTPGAPLGWRPADSGEAQGGGWWVASCPGWSPGDVLEAAGHICQLDAGLRASPIANPRIRVAGHRCRPSDSDEGGGSVSVVTSEIGWPPPAYVLAMTSLACPRLAPLSVSPRAVERLASAIQSRAWGRTPGGPPGWEAAVDSLVRLLPRSWFVRDQSRSGSSVGGEIWGSIVSAETRAVVYLLVRDRVVRDVLDLHRVSARHVQASLLPEVG